MHSKDHLAVVEQELRAALEHHRSGQSQQAVRCYLRVLALNPALADVHLNLGALLAEIGRPEEAEQSFRRVLTLRPDSAEAHSNLGIVLGAMGRLDESEKSYRQALALKPELAMAHSNLGVTLRKLERLQESELSCRRALALKPDYAEAYFNLAAVLSDLGRIVEARQRLLEGLVHKPDHPEAHDNLGNVFRMLGQLGEAERSFRRALELRPDSPSTHSSLIFALDLKEGVGVEAQQEERRRWYERHGRRYAETAQPHGNDADPERKLRIGYVSADFYRHSASYVFGPAVCGLNRSAFEVVCYSGVKREDDVTARFRQAAGEWRDTRGVPDEQLAAQIRDDRIDILVDLSGHSPDNRLLVFARKPAPVQVTALGYPTGTGMRAIDCVLSDPVMIPPDSRGHYAERVLDLPCSVCYEPPDYMPGVSRLPALDSGQPVFGCINRLEKISGRIAQLWSRILAALPRARLLIKDAKLDDSGVRGHLAGILGGAGIPAQQVRFVGGSPHANHLKIYNSVDLGLDPYPHGGGVSTLEALWMGVPVVTLAGQTPASRVSASILSALGMQEWIAGDDEEYVRIAMQSAGNPRRLDLVRRELRGRMLRSIIGNTQGYARALELTYRDLWRRWCETR